MTRFWRTRIAALLAAAMVLTGCSNDPERVSDFALLAGFGATLLAPLRDSGGAQPAAATPEEVATLLGQLPAGVPVVRIELQEFGQAAFALETGRNAGARTFTSFSGQSVTFRGGVLIATRGLAFDLMSSRTNGAESLVSRRNGGSVSRIYRFLDSSDDEVDFPVTCNLAREGQATIALVSGERFSTTRMRETCQTGSFTFNNFYWVTGSGRVVKSQQWVSRRVGMVQIEHVRG